VNPIIWCKGVRSSWLMVTRNSDFARLAASAILMAWVSRSFARLSSRVRCRTRSSSSARACSSCSLASSRPAMCSCTAITIASKASTSVTTSFPGLGTDTVCGEYCRISPSALCLTALRGRVSRAATSELTTVTSRRANAEAKNICQRLSSSRRTIRETSLSVTRQNKLSTTAIGA